MALADSNRLQILFKAQTAFGSAIVSPVAGMQGFLVKGEGLAHKNDVVMSDLIIPDATRQDQSVVGYSAAGTLNTELVYGAIDPFLAAVLRSAWTANVLSNGTTPTYFLIEKAFLNVANYFAFTDCAVDSIKITVTRKQNITYEISLMSTQGIESTVTIADANPTAAIVGTSMTASGNFANLQIGGVGSTDQISSVELTIKNNLRGKDVVGSLLSAEYGQGYLEVSGSVEVYFNTLALYQSAKNNTALALAFSLGGSGSKRYDVSLPKIKFTPDSPTASGANQDVMLKLPFTAFKDSVSGKLMTVTRVP